MKLDDFKKMYHSDDMEQNRKILFEMAAICRDMIGIEIRLIDQRITRFLTVNGFLFTSLGIILNAYKDFPRILIFVSLAFAVLGSVLAIWVYKRGLDNSAKTILHTHTRWLDFLKTFFDYSLPLGELNTNYCVPPIAGLIRNEFVSDIQNRRITNSSHILRSPIRLAHVMAIAWITLFLVVLLYNTVPCLKEFVLNNPTSPASCASQGGTITPIPAQPLTP